MAVTPQTELRLLKCNLNLDNNNQLTFSNATAQYNYFNGLSHRTITDISYQRKDSYVRFPEHIDNLIEYNYVMYKNKNYSNKWFYAYITKMEYEHDNCTRIYIKTDVWQTWQFDLTFMRSFVEREHVNDDTAGKHTVPENLETGDYISCKLQPSDDNFECCSVVALTEPLILNQSVTNQRIPNGLCYYGFTDPVGPEHFIRKLSAMGKLDSVQSVFVAPKEMFTNWQDVADVAGQVSGDYYMRRQHTIEVTKVNYLANDYTPVNKKLLCFPYSFLQVSNKSGQIVNYKWENFNLLTAASINKYQFNIFEALTPGCSILARPVNYNNILNNNDDTITGGKLPIGAWTGDVYTNWLTQNGVNIGINLASAGLQVAGGIGLMATGGGGFAGAGSIASGITGIATTLGSVYEHRLLPDSAGGNVNCGDVNYEFFLYGLDFKRMSIKEEYARIIDNFFSMYGYKVNVVKTPNITGRSNWNYVKLINPNIEGYIPQEDLSEIKDLFSNGITLWHTTSHFLDYSQNNSII